MDFDTMLNTMHHVKVLEAHGATVNCHEVPTVYRDVNLDLFYGAMNSLRQCGALAICYDMRIPETDEPLQICFHRDGRVWTGSAAAIQSILDTI